MNFIDDIVGFGGNLSPTESEPLSTTIARTAALSELLNRIVSTNRKENNADPDNRNIVTTGVDPNYSIPVVYGEAFVGGVVTDAAIDSNCATMWFCITICEKTGTLLSTGQPSAFKILEVYWDDSKVKFQGDGSTVDKFITNDADVNDKVSGKIEMYFYGGDSITPLNGGGVATGLMPNWTGNHVMSDLVFAIVKVEYDRDAGITQLGDLSFKVKNTMTEPGDVLYDYITNTRYGAGLDPAEINGI
jgi:hypothetical protein